VSRDVEISYESKDGMSLAELDAFVAEAAVAGFDQLDTIVARVTWRGHLQRLTIKRKRDTE
jgi:hypothetical protein